MSGYHALFILLPDVPNAKAVIGTRSERMAEIGEMKNVIPDGMRM